MNTTFAPLFAQMNQPICDARCVEAEIYNLKVWLTMVIVQSREKLLYDSQLHEMLRNLVRYILAPMFFAYLFSIPQNSHDVNVNIKMEASEEEEQQQEEEQAPQEEAPQQEEASEEDAPFEMDCLEDDIVEQLRRRPDGMTVKALLRSLQDGWPNLTRESVKARLHHLYDNFVVRNFVGRNDSLLWAEY